tara:strand:- start:1951 stop:2301 length:351 start_codon:yes stop_codon:yes gene_type:complete
MSSPPALQNLEIYRATDWVQEYHLENEQSDGSYTAMDLSGFSIASQAWDEERDYKFADFVVAFVDRANGKFKLSLTDDQTVNFPDELYYDIVVTNGTGEKETYVKGKIKVLQGYTR